MFKQLQEIIIGLYWRSCQYPWYIFLNIGLAALFYILALNYGRSIHVFIWDKTFGLKSTEGHFFTFLLDLVTPYVFFSLLITLLSIPVLLHKGIVFNVLGYTFFYWFLFFPLHLFFAIIRDEMWTRLLRLPILIIGVILIIFFILSIFYFPNQIKERHFVVKTDKLDKKIRIVHMSDIHAENYGSREARLVSIVNEQNPDIILITGDMFIKPYRYNSRGFNAAVRILNQLDPKYGIFLVEGHHDYREVHHVADALPQKVRLLNDEWIYFDIVNISAFGASLYSDKTDFTENIQNKDFRIYFSHDPDRIKNLKSEEFNLALFGHTHASQVYIPVLSYLIVGKYRHGFYHCNNMPIYVNAGIGLEGYLAPRIRWLTFPEVVIIDLKPPN